MRKSRLIVFSCLMLLVLLVSACSPAVATPAEAPASTDAAAPAEASTEAATEAAPAAEPVTITFWHTYNEESAENDMLVNTLIPMFESQHPEIHVEALSVPYDDFRTKLITAISGGVAPDLIRSDIIWVPELAEMGALTSLDENMPDFADFSSVVFPGPLSTNYWNGHYYGLPLDTNTKVWMYNPALYEQAGITAPASIDELEADCQAIKAVDPDAYLFSADGMYAWVMLPWIWSFGGSVTDPEITTATGYLNGPETVAAYEFWLKMYDEGCFSPLVLGDGVDAFTGLAQGNYASIDNGPWSYPIFEAQFPEQSFEASLFPAGEGGSIEVVGGEDINLMAQSQHPAEAMEFIRFLLSQDYQLKMTEVGQMPVRSDLSDTDTIQNHPYFGIFLEQLQTSQARTAHPAWSKMDEIITNAGQLILRHEMTPQEALDDAAAQIDALLNQ